MVHVVAVDGQIFTGLDRGSFDKQGIDFELVERNTGPEVFEAMARGEVDVLSAGGVISNYLALGAGRAFLINDIEVATAQLWVRPDLGVRTFADLRGKPIATTTRTTAHIFLDRALRANSIDNSEVEVRNSSMSAAVAAFISGEVPAVALWVPFNIMVREKVPGAVKLVDASAFYPQSAVVGGWVARHDYYGNNRDVLGGIIRGWADANDLYPAQQRGCGAGFAEESLPPCDGCRHYRSAPGAKDVFVAGVETALFRRHRRQSGFSRSATSSWPAPASRMRNRPRNISIPASILRKFSEGAPRYRQFGQPLVFRDAG